MKNMKWLFIVLLILKTNLGCFSQQKMETQVFIDKLDSSSMITKTYLLPYLDHFGIVYEIADINTKKLYKRAGDYSLVIIGQGMKNPKTALNLIQKIQSKGAGVISFDPDWPFNKMDSQPSTGRAKLISFNIVHYITALHEKTDAIKCSIKLPFRNVTRGIMESFVFADSKPLLVSKTGEQWCVKFTSLDWMKTYFVGPMMGLDDFLWRSTVRVARKPFIMRGLSPIVTMRVDDVAGRGVLWQKSPLYWVGTTSKYGLKPWLGLFIYNLNPETINELRSYILNGQAIASSHACGRSPRFGMKNLDIRHYVKRGSKDTNAGFYYNPKAMPLREKEYDVFIYFDHQHFKPWSIEEARRDREAVDRWYAETKHLPKLIYFVAHWYEARANVVERIETDICRSVVKTELTGNSDVKSHFYIFTEKDEQIDQRLV